MDDHGRVSEVGATKPLATHQAIAWWPCLPFCSDPVALGTSGHKAFGSCFILFHSNRLIGFVLGFISFH